MDDMMISEGKQPTLLHGKYEMGRLLGHGTFAKVYVARNVHSGDNVAMKVVGKEKIVQVGMMEQVKREISVMKMVSHPNIVELHEVMANKSKIYLAMELVRGGELFKQIAKSGRLKEPVARSYFRQLISAVDFCHSRGVYHRDLKPENLLLDDEGNLKVADFGLSALADHTRPDGLLHTTCGTPAYVAPEIIKKKGYDGAKADVWSCGVILYVLLAGRLPFHDENLVNMYKKIHRGDFKCPPWFSTEARRLVTKLLDPNPNTRITIAKLHQTPWFRRSSSMPVLSGEAVAGRWGKDKPEMLTAFHIISLSEGFDLSPMFEERRRDRDGELRFATRESAAGVTERLEKAGEGMFNVRKSELEVRLESLACGRRGRVAVVAEMFPVAPSVLVVEVKRESGDEFEYGRFCAETLRPALVDIMWASSDSKENDVVLN